MPLTTVVITVRMCMIAGSLVARAVPAVPVTSVSKAAQHSSHFRISNVSRRQCILSLFLLNGVLVFLEGHHQRANVMCLFFTHASLSFEVIVLHPAFPDKDTRISYTDDAPYSRVFSTR